LKQKILVQKNLRRIVYRIVGFDGSPQGDLASAHVSTGSRNDAAAIGHGHPHAQGNAAKFSIIDCAKLQNGAKTFTDWFEPCAFTSGEIFAGQHLGRWSMTFEA